MILFIAPFPDPSQGDGWMARILAVDEIFKNRPRAYVYDRFVYKGGRPDGYEIYYKQHDNLREEYILNYSISRHVRVLTKLIEKADFVYAHTAHSARHMLPYYSTGKIVTDLHGLASLEEEMMGFPERARFYGALEESMIRGSASLVVVTKAMEQHFRNLYPGLKTNFILNPIRQVLPEANKEELSRPLKEKPVVIFAGGAQEWQQPRKMIQVAAQLKNLYTFEFYTAWETSFRKLMEEENIITEEFYLGFCSRTELVKKYKNADFGFVLRTESPVNRVACPTKLMEYMAFGVIPVVEFYEIGDFSLYNYNAISLKDFISGKLPDLDTLNIMRAENFKIFELLNGQCDSGILSLKSIEKLQPLLDMHKNASLFLPTVDRMAFASEDGICYFHINDKKNENCIILRNIPFDNGCVNFDFPCPCDLIGLRIKLFDAPFAVTPVSVFLEDTQGVSYKYELKKNYIIDKHGNYFFMDNGFMEVDIHNVICSIKKVSIHFSLLLSKGETLLFSNKL